MKLKITKTLARWACTLCAVGVMEEQSIAQWNPLGEWNFNSGDLSAAFGGDPLQYADGPGGDTAAGTLFGTADSFGISRINGTDVNVMKFPASSASMGYLMPNPVSGNGAGSLVNNYTVIMDVLYPTNSAGRVRPLLQTDDQVITPGADIVVDSSDAIGEPPGPFHGSIQPNVWYRLGFSVTDGNIDEYINGVKVGSHSTGGPDSQFALTPSGFAALFQNSTTNGAAVGYVSSIQIQDVALNAGQMAALGAASASKITTNSPSIPSYLEAQTPSPNAANVTPLPQINAVLNSGGTVVDTNSVYLALDGSALGTTINYTGSNYVLTASTSSLLLPYSIHTASVVYSDSSLGLQTNSWSFSICKYQNINLPAPIYLETFDSVTPGDIPAGWVATNWTDTLTPGFDLSDPHSDSYKDFVTISVSQYASAYPDTETYTSPGYPTISGNRRQMIPPIVENGVLLTNLASGNLLVAESDQRDGSQVQVITTKDFDFSTNSNVYVSFHHLNEQNQDNICSLEYSINGGATWLPLLYMLDDGTTDNNGSDVVKNPLTGLIDVNATFNTARNDQAHGLSFGSFIGAAINDSLIPYIRGCRNDDPIQQKRIELFRLPLADGQSAVRLRFMQAGTGSWYYSIDNLGFYSIPDPIVLQQPTPVNADYNGPATFTVVAGGTNLTYQWKFNGVNILGATNATYSIANCVSNNVGLYRVGISNSFGGVLSDEVGLTLVYTPVILNLPQDATITLGSSATFNISARGGQPLSYQWLFNSNAIPGAVGTNYTVANATTNNSGSYQVVVSNAFSTVVSKIANLTVFAGSITQDMVVHLTFDNTYADSSGRGNNATNVNNPTFEPGFLGQAVHLTSTGTPANNPATNNYVTLGYPSDLVFGTDPGAKDFSVSFWTKIFSQNDDKPFIANKDWDSGSNPGWDINTQSDGMKWNYRDNAVNQPGVGNTRRDSPHVGSQLVDGGWHHVVVSFARHSYARTYIDGVLADQTNLGTDSPTNILGSADTTGLGFGVNIGQDGTGTYTDGSGGAAVDMLMDDVAIWRRVVTDQEASGIFNAGLHSNTVDQATTTTPGAKPIVTLQPTNSTVNSGVTATFKVSVIGTASLAYQWYFGSTPLAGATNTTLLVTNALIANQGNYKLVITNNYGAVTSSIASLTVNAAPSITAQPVNQTVLAGSAANFSVTASGAAPLVYQWFKGSTALTTQTNTTFTIPSTVAGDAGSYTVVITNNLGSITSSVVTLTVITTPVFTTQPKPLFVSPSAAASFTVAVTAPGTVTYQWLKNGTPIGGATTNPFALSSVVAADDADYSVVASNSFGSSTSIVAHLTVFTGQIGQGVVAYLPFDGDFKDYSGRNNHGSAVGSPTFSTGRVGQALHFKTTADGVTRNYVTLGYPNDLKFGSGNFTVMLWVNYTNQVDDPSLLANKDWGSSSNIGFGIFAQGGGNFRVSCTGTPRGSGNRFNLTPANIIRDGNWHQLVCTFWRGQVVSTYLDGVLISSSALTITGSVDTADQGLAINIGQDGKGAYTDGGAAAIEGDIDEVVFWNRLITAQEVAQLYTTGTNNLNPIITVTTNTVSAGAVNLGWHGGVPPFTVQSTANLANTNWNTATTTSNQNATVTPSGNANFFRVRGNNQ